MESNYPEGTVRALLKTARVTSPTRTALEQRLGEQDVHPTVLDQQAMAVLEAVAARLLPQTQRGSIDLAGALHQRLAVAEGDGWRYATMPPDLEAHRLGLRGLEQSAQLMFETGFVTLTGPDQDAVLQAVQSGLAPGQIWEQLPARRYFEELLAELTEAYYSHPLAQEEIGYAGMADAQGWRAIGLNERESWEPVAGAPLTVDPVTSTQPPRTTSPPIYSSYRPEEVVDAVIIGTGAGGAPLLARLAQAGLKVVALEAGEHWNPAQDFATDEKAQSKLFWNDERLSAGEDPIAFGRNNSGTGVGGSTLHYTAYVPRAQPDDFRLHSDFGVGVDWPLGYQDLEPYYDELERFLGVSGPSPYPWGPERASYPLPPLPLNGAAQLMERGCRAMGIRTSPAANAALSAPYYQPGVGWRQACTNRGFCQAGCTTGAKASMDVTFIPLALTRGAEVRSGAFVTGFEMDAAGRITSVVYRQGDREERQRCRAVFLCAGAIETPRLLLLHDLANSSGQVGRNFMAHPGVQVWGQFPETIRPYKGIPGGLISEDTHRPAGADFAGGYLLQSIGVMPVTYASQVARGKGLWGDPLKTHMLRYNHTAGINILGECLPYAHNYLELTDELDKRGLPKPRVHFTNGENERRMNAHAEALMRQIWEAAGATATWTFARNAHIIGTCRMGRDPDQAVVDPEGRSFDIPNLYIADNAVFPSALSVNPALTIMALSLRIADCFIERLRRAEA
ncbi:MAG: gluconate 2-dehydrogenase subunit 3 family protein [Gemmatimonadaceae bacterium]|nr:gluconate 2-dehydrogenase subunit 3 family protein [Gloeobacterales cyanobacterium ES-bin-141]